MNINNNHTQLTGVILKLCFLFICISNYVPDTLDIDTLTAFDEAVKEGKITEKETKLWKFVLSFYGNDEFSTKQLEKDFGDAAYATIRGFVLKFEKLGLLSSVKYGTRVKYKVVQ